MSNDVREALREAVTVFGTDLGSDARRCRAVLLDWCPRRKREIRVLEATVEEGVPEAILAKRQTVPRVVLVESLAKQVYENQGIDLELSRWSVACWMDAMEGQTAKGTRAMNQGQNAGGTGGAGGAGVKGGARRSRWLLKLTLVVVVLGFFGGIVYGLVWSVSALIGGGSAGGGEHGQGVVVDPAPVKKDPPRLDPPKVDPPRVDPPIAKPVLPPKPVSPWDDPGYVVAQGESAVAKVEALRERVASRRGALAKSVEAATKDRASAASLNVYVPRAFQRAVDEDRWPFRASGFTFTRAQGERVIDGVRKYLAVSDASLKRAEGVAASLEGLEKDAVELKGRLLCAIGKSSEAGCAGVVPARERVEPLIRQSVELENRGIGQAADPVFEGLDVAKLAGPP